MTISDVESAEILSSSEWRPSQKARGDIVSLLVSHLALKLLLCQYKGNSGEQRPKTAARPSSLRPRTVSRRRAETLNWMGYNEYDRGPE